MLRWHVVPRNRWLNVYLHKIVRSDDDRALHDHPWASLSLILAAGYLEVTPAGRRYHGAGSVIYRSTTYSHRLEIENGRPCWTLFVTGPKQREWGFLCPRGWRHWREFCKAENRGEVGQGCGEA